MKAVALGHGGGVAHAVLGAGHCEQLVEAPSDHPDGESGVAGGGEGHHPQLVEGAAPVHGEVEHVEGGGTGHVHVIEGVVEAGGGLEAHHVPVAGDLGLFHRVDGEQEAGVGSLGLFGEHPRAGPLGVVDAAAKGVAAADSEAIAVGDGGAVRGELSRRQGHPVGKHALDVLVGAPGPEVGRGRPAGHQAPAHRSVSPGYFSPDVDALVDRELNPAHRIRHHHLVQLGIHQGVHRLLGNGQPVGLGRILVDQRAQLPSPVKVFAGHAKTLEASTSTGESANNRLHIRRTRLTVSTGQPKEAGHP